MRIFVIAFLASLSVAACTAKTAIPIEFPTPPPPDRATPVPAVEYKRDADLERQFAEIANDAKGKVGVAAVVIETGEAAFLNEKEAFPMQSVYKLPISMAVIEQVRLEKLGLDEKIAFTKDDMVRAGQASVVRDKNPNGAEYTIRELIRLALVESDGTASDVLMRVAGGAEEIQAYLTQIGVRDIKVLNTEKELGADQQLQYKNSATPMAAADLLKFLDSSYKLKTPLPDLKPEDAVGEALILKYMNDAVTGPKRLRGGLPAKTILPHKTGTSGTRDGVTAATNDIGVIYLPNGRHVAIAVFVSDSPADEKTREAVIARIAKAVWDNWGK
jgi:beta-lactamase class A